MNFRMYIYMVETYCTSNNIKRMLLYLMHKVHTLSSKFCTVASLLHSSCTDLYMNTKFYWEMKCTRKGVLIANTMTRKHGDHWCMCTFSTSITAGVQQLPHVYRTEITIIMSTVYTEYILHVYTGTVQT